MRWGDMDAQGHINNATFLVYLEQARVALFFDRAAECGVATIADGVVVARHEIDYLRPVGYRPAPLRIELWCSDIGGASMTIEYEVFDGDVKAVTARSVCVRYDVVAGRVKRLDPAEREFISGFLA